LPFVTFLETVRRQAGDSQRAFRDLLLRWRDARGNEADYDLIKPRLYSSLMQSPAGRAELATFEEKAAYLYQTKAKVAARNSERLAMLPGARARVRAEHSSAVAAAASSDDASQLHAMLDLKVGMRVMATQNVWIGAGVCNGSLGTVVDIVYEDGRRPPALPTAVIVRLDQYSGPSIYSHRDGLPDIPDADVPEHLRRCVPFVPWCAEWTVKDSSAASKRRTEAQVRAATTPAQVAQIRAGAARGTVHTRNQLPLIPAFAITIHKSQGLTLELVVVDIGPSDNSTGQSFVALSRAVTLQGVVVRNDISGDRMNAKINTPKMRQRIQDEARLRVAAATCRPRWRALVDAATALPPGLHGVQAPTVLPAAPAPAGVAAAAAAAAPTPAPSQGHADAPGAPRVPRTPPRPQRRTRTRPSPAQGSPSTPTLGASPNPRPHRRRRAQFQSAAAAGAGGAGAGSGSGAPGAAAVAPRPGGRRARPFDRAAVNAYAMRLDMDVDGDVDMAAAAAGWA